MERSVLTNMVVAAGLLTSAMFPFGQVADCRELNDYILDYQPLVYDRQAVHSRHQRARRSADGQLHVKFTAYGRHFELQLTPASGVFTADHQVHTDGTGLHRVDTSFIYHGHVKGEPGSAVHMAVHSGSIEGSVEVADTIYHIEPAAKYIPHPAFHTIIYPDTHLDTDPYRARRKAEQGTCGMTQAVRQFLEQASRLEEGSRPSPRTKWDTMTHERPRDLYSERSNRRQRSTSGQSSSASLQASLGANNTCTLHVRADPLLFDFFKNQKHGFSRTDQEAEEEILAFFASHVNAISAIYSNTVFQTYGGGMENVGLTFAIHRSTVMKNCEEGGGRDSNYCANTVDVSNYLELTSSEDHDLYCLVFTFTYRDFSGGTLGLAWVASESSTQSGVCGRYSMYSGGKKKSLNTGIVTIINYGKTVPNRVSQLTLAHEVGHNFGSPHDIGSAECAPFGTNQPLASNGNYIMFPSATGGNKPNNDKFSPCSKDNMTRIIQQVVDGVRHRCFVESGEAFCGNRITEGEEECDCGFGTCDSSTCCVGRDDERNVKGCTLMAGKECSPDSGPCCADGCLFAGTDQQCEEDTACKFQSSCNGSSYQCPAAQHKPNGTFCNDNSRVCLSGECIASVCRNIVASQPWEECFQTSADGQSQDELCFVACKNPTTGKCISSQNTAALEEATNAPFKTMLTTAARNKTGEAQPDTSQLPITLPPGSACDNFRGYCDTFSKCQRIDSQGPFNQLTNMIFDPVNLKKIKDWIVGHWWGMLLICIGVVVLMGCFIKVCGYNTPSEDPKKKRLRQRQNQGRSGQPRHSAAPPPQRGSAPPPYSVSMEMERTGHHNYGYSLSPGHRGAPPRF